MAAGGLKYTAHCSGGNRYMDQWRPSTHNNYWGSTFAMDGWMDG